MKRILIVLLAALSMQACNDSDEQQETKLDKTAWLLGYWEMQSPDGSSVTESWIRSDDSSFSGAGKFKDSTGHVVSAEEIRIVLRDKQLLYIPVVSNQNDGNAVVFTEVEFTDSIMVFENMQHDFPQRIVYQRIADDSLLAYIEGNMGGETRRIEFPYKKQ